MREIAIVIVIYPKTTHAYDASVVITYFCVSGLDNTSEFIVIHGNILNLDYGSVIIVLYVGVVIVTGIVINIYISGVDVYIHISVAIVTKVYKVELTIGEN